MKFDDYEKLPPEEKEHFTTCSKCGEIFDRRSLDEVLFHHTDHKQRPDIQHAGSRRLDKSVGDPVTIARRFGKTYHISYLRKKLERLRKRDPEPMGSYEEWLINAAQRRADNRPGEEKLAGVPNEELIVTLLLLENIDRPRLFETASLLLSRIPVDEREVARLAKQEGVDFLLPWIKQ